MAMNDKARPRRQLFPKDNVGARSSKEQVDKGYTVSGSASELKRLKDLNDRVTDMQMDMADFTGRGQLWLDTDNKNVPAEMSAQNKMFQNRMMMMCVMPLAQGINKESLAQSMGMYIGMMAFNPEFRRNIVAKQGELYKKMAGGGDAYAYSKDSTLKERVEKALAKGNNGRVPFSQESAACMEIGLSREAYAKMREPGANPEEVMQQYRKAQNTLYELAERDGVSKEDVQKGARIMVGKFTERERDLMGDDYSINGGMIERQYQELGFDTVVQSDASPREEYRLNKETGLMESHTIHTWEGGYHDHKTGEPFEGSFGPRMPSDLDFYADHQANFIKDHLMSVEASTPEDVIDVRNTLIHAAKRVSANVNGEEAPPLPDDIKDDAIHNRALHYYTKYMRMAIEDGHSMDDIVESLDVAWSKAGVAYQYERPEAAAGFYQKHYSDPNTAREPKGSEASAESTTDSASKRRLPVNLPDGYENLFDDYTPI